jgi:cell wall assembly regulator SMI1
MEHGLAESWRRIVAWYEAHTPPGTLRLPPDASDEALAAAEAKVGFRLPGDVRSFYRLHDGLGGSWLLHYGEFLSLGNLVMQWGWYAEMDRTQDPADPLYQTKAISGPIKPVWWSSRRLPVTDNSGNHTMIDLDPAPGGAVGQVIIYDHEVGPTRVLAPSFAAWLVRIAAGLEAGELIWRQERGQVEPSGFSEPGGYLIDWESTWAGPGAAADRPRDGG